MVAFEQVDRLKLLNLPGQGEVSFHLSVHLGPSAGAGEMKRVLAAAQTAV